MPANASSLVAQVLGTDNGRGGNGDNAGNGPDRHGNGRDHGRGGGSASPPAATAASAPQGGPQATAANVAPAPAPAPAPAAAPTPPQATVAASFRRAATRSGDVRVSDSSKASSTRRAASTPAANRSTAGTGQLALDAGARSGLLSTSPGASGTGAATLTGALAPGTASFDAKTTAAARAHAAARHSHHHGPTPVLPVVNLHLPTVIDHFIKVIPTGVWIALAASLALAAIAGMAAFRSNRRVRRQAGEVAAVTAAALTDPLTSVLNRRGFLEAAERELDRARRYGHPMALAFVDIRGLKAVNDTEGHLAGDRLLKQVTTLLQDSGRTHDVVGRIGGDELAVLLPEQSAEGAAAMTQRVHAQVPAARANLNLLTAWDVTIGTAVFPDDGDTFEELLAAADRRLYEQRGISLT
jgi:diguanylate cyclase (GGDEF)-like protein